ncbi:hypothetical protein CCACVL1_27711 [Corchorus capsularis]|uniref:non-specific serine/threonine protein kinase n=1 Tax=Corchorus capsularis TaxID=210143 RepID=A0A1R3G996_COCAP|nr:hypothetical protein CCACVL1_27711 [Corchorus capsularis]
MMAYQTQLPEEIDMEILERLPVKSLIRFKSVCKSWKSLISASCFIDHHFSRSAANSNKVGIALAREYKGGRSYCEIYIKIINLSPTSLGETTSFIEHVVTECQKTRPLGWCRGLLLLSVDCRDCKLLLSNPSTRESKEILDPPYRRLEFENISAASILGYDFNIKSHKIVLIYELDKSEYRIWVYTLTTNSWTCVDLDTDHKYADYDIFPITLANGAPHWLIRHKDKVGSGAHHVIEYFDFAVSKFVVVPQPGDYDNRKFLSPPILYDTEGSLCIVYRDGFNLEIWVMKRYGVKESWLKWMSFKNEYVPYPIRFGKININVSLVVARGDQGERCCAIYNGKQKEIELEFLKLFLASTRFSRLEFAMILKQSAFAFDESLICFNDEVGEVDKVVCKKDLARAIDIPGAIDKSEIPKLHVGLSNGVSGNVTDQQALLEFKAKITSDPVGVMKWWNNSVHFCEWPGITCGRRHQRVIGLDLQSCKLTGAISPYVGNLSFLRVLDLQNNSFSHEIPPEVGLLRRLRGLILANNSIGGEIPSNISGCTQLRVLDVARNQLIGEIPVVLGSLSNLKLLYLYRNKLRGSIPQSFGNLTSLDELSVVGNRLRGPIPEILGQLASLTFFSVAVNQLSGVVPSSIFNLSNLHVIDIGVNQIQGSLPWDIGFTMPSLEVLAVGNNQLTGMFPPSVSNATNLNQLEVVQNNFTGNLPSFEKLEKLQSFTVAINSFGKRRAGDLNFLCSLTNATNLQLLDLGGNRFGGVIPECISILSVNVWLFDIDGNEIWGEIPAGVGNLINLELLSAYDNQISGHIPPTIGMLHKLQVFYLHNNALFGIIPPSLGHLKILTELYLSNNNLQGNIPLNLSKCQNLAALDLSNNNLSGSIPPELVGLSSLSILLDLSFNHLTGILPTQVGNLKNLGVLDVSHNMLSGVLPSSLGSCIMLDRLRLGNNFFQGSIPDSLSSLKGLTLLDLSRNNLSGEIPESFMTFKSLKYLNLSYNDFDGPIPTEGIFKNASAAFLQGNNKLCGGMPEFRLLRCNVKKSRGRTSLPKRIAIATVCGLLGVTLLFLLFVRFILRKKEKQPTPSNMETSLLQLSYQSILKATDGFSTTNLVGSGSFGSIFKGILEETGVVIAVKVLNLLSHKASRSFISECEALRNVRHRNLVKLLTACSSIDNQGNDFKALVYEFMVHGSLEDWLHPSIGINEVEEAPKKLNFSQRLNVAIDVACALEYLHHHCETSIVHCDLKPSNILLDDEMVGHVGDFGLAKIMPEEMQNFSTSLSSSLRGTIGYVAPEYGLGNKVSTSIDVYSYGILLLEMFTGKRPTDEMFKEDLNLHNYVKLALPERVAEVTDHILLQEISRGGRVANNTRNQTSNQREQRFLECLISVFNIGVTCSAKLPSERMNMTAVGDELCPIREKLLPTRRH